MGFFARVLAKLGLRSQVEDDDLDAEGRDSGRDGGGRVDVTREFGPGGDAEEDLAGVVRDPALEAEDDQASFDFERDIARYFTAEFRLEQAWANTERREQLLSEYQLRDGAHWYQVKATFERWLSSPVGRSKYPSESALMQARMTTTQTVTVDELEAMIEDARRAKG